jgi:hypothetical protein
MLGMVVIILALFIDGLQALLAAGFFAALPPILGTAGGVASAGAACTVGAGIGAAATIWVAGVGAIAGAAAGCVGGAVTGWLIGAPIAAASGVPLAIGLGFVVDICISCTLGAGLILLLGFGDMFYPKYVLGGGLFELLPGFDALPGWTVMAVLCVLKKKSETGSGLLSVAANIVTTGAAVAEGDVGGALKGGARVARAVDGITAPVNNNASQSENDNRPRRTVYAA